ncbi:MAG: TPM domain-containing protein [Betaproteobacteria bacterium]|nr:TPM domain-containing protein [Betaproteobacteria bacterium]
MFCDRWSVRRAFPARSLRAIEGAIAEQEGRHMGELRFAVEASLPFDALIQGVSARDRAVELFGRLRVWDTEHNSGVLVYLLLAERDVEIVADRGIHARVGSGLWEEICGRMQAAFARGQFEQGAIAGLRAISDLLAAHFPPSGENPNELPDKPLVI